MSYSMSSSSKASMTQTSRKVSPSRPIHFPPILKGYPSYSHRTAKGIAASRISTGVSDRFIPNSRIDFAQARSSLFQVPSCSREISTEQESYNRQLRQALGLGPSNAPMMVFGPKPKESRQNKISSVRFENPYSHGLPLPQELAPLRFRTPSRRRNVIERVFTLEAPDVLPDDDLNLISYGPSLAVALDDQLYLWTEGEVELFTSTDDGNPISALKWSNNRSKDENLLAVGLESSVEVWCTKLEGVVAELHDHTGFVTAFCWRGYELLAASEAGIKRYNLKEEDPKSITYHGHDGQMVTCLQWNENTIASAGNGVIHIWDANHQGDNIKPLRTMHHTGVRCLEFCPGQKNCLVSGGTGGLKFWNVQNGTLRETIEIGDSLEVTGVVWSKPGEILISHGNKLSLWDLSSKTMKVADICTRGGKVLSMDQGDDGLIACIHEDEVLTGYSLPESRKTAKTGSRGRLRNSGLLEIPTIR